MGKFLDPRSLIKICQSLEKAYPSPKDWPKGEWPLSGEFKPRRFEVVVGAILTQNVNWKNVEKALSRMIEEQLVEADQIEGCSQAFLEDTIRSAGFYRQKAKRLQGMARFILAYPSDFYSEVRREELLSIPGIGPETADSILLYALGKPVFVIDAYTKRVLSRHGIIEYEKSYDEFQELFHSTLEKSVPLFNEYHALFVRVGKAFCKRKNPLCKNCPLERV